jgi:hypothetical protein
MEDKQQIFLSYAYEDRERVSEISEELTKAGYQTWMDVENLLPGQDWDNAIKDALRASDFVFIFLSKNSITKQRYLQKEIKSALRLAEEKPEGKFYIIPVKLEDVELPDNLKHIQWLEFNKKDSWNRLLSVLKVYRQRKSQDYEELRMSVKDVKSPKKHIFVAMPFSNELEDSYFYGIKVPIENAGFNCVRVDRKSFIGDILVQIKLDIETASAVVALLDGVNPNVSLEVGYAWGNKVPTILLIKDTSQLPFDLKGQKCIVYDSIRGLEKSLATELNELIGKGTIK